MYRNRLVLLGASNLTLSLRLVTHLMQHRFGGPSEVFAAAGHGRGYGVSSQMLWRGLPGIVASGLWRQLVAMESRPTYALLTDIGNDIMYESPPEQVLRAVEWCVTQLRQQSARIVVTNLPLTSIERLSKQHYLLFRNLFYPTCKLSRNEALRRAVIVHDELVGMAARMHFTLYEQSPLWFGFDGIHINYRQRRAYYEDVIARFPVVDFSILAREFKLLRGWRQRPSFAFKTIAGCACYCPQPSGRLWDESLIFKY